MDLLKRKIKSKAPFSVGLRQGSMFSSSESTVIMANKFLSSSHVTGVLDAEETAYAVSPAPLEKINW